MITVSYPTVLLHTHEVIHEPVACKHLNSTAVDFLTSGACQLTKRVVLIE